MELEMRILSAMEIAAIAGGFDDSDEDEEQSGSSGYSSGSSGSGSGSIPVVTITASKADVAAAKADDSNVCGILGGLAGFGSGAVVGSACIIGATVLTDGAATAPMAKPCATAGAFTGVVVGWKTTQICNRAIRGMQEP